VFILGVAWLLSEFMTGSTGVSKRIARLSDELLDLVEDFYDRSQFTRWVTIGLAVTGLTPVAFVTGIFLHDRAMLAVPFLSALALLLSFAWGLSFMIRRMESRAANPLRPVYTASLGA